MTQNNKYNGLEIAIIGISAQFPGSRDYRGYWENLKEGRELIKEFSEQELLASGVSETELKDPDYLTSFGMLDNKDAFDHVFFGYSKEEAWLMDPQIRLFHENCWSALEDSGYAGQLEKVKAGLFAGASENNNWKLYVNQNGKEAAVDPFFVNSISNHSFIHSLISYKLNLRGPSYYIDTACSTSLVAVHLACRSLLTKECTIALAGGVSLQTVKKKGYYYREGMIVSKDGHCRAYDADANGTTVGEGAGVVVLKRLAEAIKDKDQIYAVIKSTAVNNDGNHKVGYTAPSVRGQAECIRTAHKLGGIDPRSISYIEGHGTATNLGDPVEIRALNEAFAISGTEKYCAIGSVKTNMGHLNAAAGIAGLIKAVLCLRYKEIPPSLHFKEPNPEIDFDNGPFYVNTALSKMNSQMDFPLRAGVSSFGIGGTNAHVVLEEAPVTVDQDENDQNVLVVSAKTEPALIRYLEGLKDFILNEPGLNLSDMAYTLQVGHKDFMYRKAISYKDRDELLSALNNTLKDQVIKSTGRKEDIIFMFPGQGSQYVNMGRGLYDSEPLIRELMDKGFTVLTSLTGEDFKEILFGDPAGVINRTQYAQPLLFLLEYALASFMITLGVVPKYMIGHSLGEYTAACISGVFSFEDALNLVVKRGILMEKLAGGAMLSAAMNERDAVPYLNENISLAAINGPGQIVFSGDIPAIDNLKLKLEERGIGHMKLNTRHAFHSYMIEPVLEDFNKVLADVTFFVPEIPFISNLSGGLVVNTEISTPGYWLRHMRNPVRFSNGIEKLLSMDKEFIFIETGPGNILSGLLKGQEKKVPESVFNLVRSSRENMSDSRKLTGQLGRLWSIGLTIDWKNYYKDRLRQKIALPTYSFESYKHPTEVNPFEGVSFSPAGKKELLHGSVKDWVYIPTWKRADNLFQQKKEVKRALFFSLGNEFSDSLTEKLSAAGYDLTEIIMGREYGMQMGTYTIDPSNFEDYTRVFNELLTGDDEVTDVIYSWGLEIESCRLELTEENEELNLGYFNLIKIVQSMSQSAQLKINEFFVLTDRLHQVIGNEKISYGQSLLLGLVNVLPHEYPFTCCNIDIDLSLPKDIVAAGLSLEISSHTQEQDRIIALRYGHRWVQGFENNGQKDGVEQQQISKGGLYLITGGLGNVGFVIAQHLINHYGARVIITGRSVINTSVNETGIPAIKINRLNHLKTLSKDTIYLNADVSDAAALKAAIKNIEQTAGNILGVIHTAAAVEAVNFELASNVSYENSLAMFSPKITGIKNLYEIFKDKKLDFAWITSSVSSVIGGIGFASYAASNSFMEHFITAKQPELANWKCVGLSAMIFDEMPAENDKPRLAALSPGEINELFLLTSAVKNKPVIIQSIEDLPQLIRKIYFEKPNIDLTGDSVLKDSLKREDQLLSSAYEEPVTATENEVRNIFENFLGIEGIGVEDDFFELGGDSLKGMMILKKIKNQFNVNLPLKDFFIQANIREVASNIDNILWQTADVDTDNELII